MNKKECPMTFEVDGILVCAYDFTNEEEDISKECSPECELKQSQQQNNNIQQNNQQRRWWKR